MKKHYRNPHAILSRLLFILCMLPLITWSQVNVRLKHAYIYIFINQNRIKPFYPVLVDQNNKPYLAIKSAVTELLDGDARCSQHDCIINIFEQEHRTVKINKKRLKNPDMLVLYKQQLWLRYDAWPSLIPIISKWNLSQYHLNFIPAFPLRTERRQKHAAQIKLQKALQARIRAIEKITPIVPKQELNLQARYRLKWQNPLYRGQGLGLTYDANADIYKGTFTISGHNRVDYWNYRRRFPGFADRFEAGEIFGEPTLLLPTMDLENGIFAERYRQTSSARGFNYKDNTQPGTEIDVWRNGFLESTINVRGNSQFTVNDPLALPGDEIILRYYYPDGSSKVKTIHIANDSGILMAQGQWDWQVLRGQLTNFGIFHHLYTRYGLTRNITTGIHLLRFPRNDFSRPAGMFDLTWHLSNTLSLGHELLGYSGGVDYAFKLNVSSWKSHNIQIETHHLGNRTPLLSLPGAALFPAMSPLVSVAGQGYYLRDNMHFASGNWIAEWQKNPNARMLDLAWRGIIFNNVATTLQSGILKQSANESSSPFFKARGDIVLSLHHMIKVARTWQRRTSETDLNYRYQGGQHMHWDLSIGCNKPDHNNYIFTMNVDWRINPRIAVGFSYDNQNIQATLAWQDIIAKQPGPRRWDEFATGTVAGTVFAPSVANGQKPTPVAYAKVKIGDRITTTDNKGHYRISGLQTEEKLAMSIEEHSLPANLKAPDPLSVVYLRAGTFIEVNPKLQWSQGLDGFIKNHGKFAAGAKVQAWRKDSSELMAEANIEEDGFFIIDGLSAGDYELKTKHVNHSLKPLTVHLANNRFWKSGIVWR